MIAMANLHKLLCSPDKRENCSCRFAVIWLPLVFALCPFTLPSVEYMRGTGMMMIMTIMSEPLYSHTYRAPLLRQSAIRLIFIMTNLGRERKPNTGTGEHAESAGLLKLPIDGN